MVVAPLSPSLEVLEVAEVVWDTNTTTKQDLPADVYICRAGNHLRFRKLRSLLELPGHTTAFGIVPDLEDVDHTQSGTDSGITCMRVDEAAAQLKVLARTAAEAGNKAFAVTIDVSCLPRRAQGMLFAALAEIAEWIPVRLAIGYVLSRYVSPPDKWARSVTPVSPVHPYFAGWGDPLLPIHVVVGLGYEAGKAFGVVQYLEPSVCTSLLPVSAEEKFLDAVQAKNKEFLARNKRIIRYDVLRPAETYLSLVAFTYGVLRDHRAILLPFGPKILFALSLLVGMLHPQVSVWYVDGEDHKLSDEGSPSGHAAIMTCTIQAASSQPAPELLISTSN